MAGTRDPQLRREGVLIVCIVNCGLSFKGLWFLVCCVCGLVLGVTVTLSLLLASATDFLSRIYGLLLVFTFKHYCCSKEFLP